MKTITQLEQEAKQARQAAITIYETDTSTMSQKVDAVILASTAMVTYQFALAGQEAIDCVPGDSDSCDGWIEWKGGECPIGESVVVETRTRNGFITQPWEASQLRWEPAGRNKMLNPDYDIIAYRIVK